MIWRRCITLRLLQPFGGSATPRQGEWRGPCSTRLASYRYSASTTTSALCDRRFAACGHRFFVLCSCARQGPAISFKRMRTQRQATSATQKQSTDNLVKVVPPTTALGKFESIAAHPPVAVQVRRASCEIPIVREVLNTWFPSHVHHHASSVLLYDSMAAQRLYRLLAHLPPLHASSRSNCVQKSLACPDSDSAEPSPNMFGPLCIALWCLFDGRMGLAPGMRSQRNLGEHLVEGCASRGLRTL